MPEGVPHPPSPTCKAILLCDSAIVDAGTGKVSLIGLIDHFTVHKFPARLPSYHAFLQITDAVGRYEIVLEIHDLQNDTVLARGQGIGIEISEKLSKANVIIPIPPLPLPHAGKYDFVVFANSQEIDRQTFTATEVEGQNESSSAE